MNNTDEELNWEIVFDIAIQVSNGLNSLHSWRPQVVHRDLKSRNILIENNWNVRLCDFGESRFAIVDNIQALTKMCGTYAYIAPEVYFGKPCSPKSDIYALGIVLWELANRSCKGIYQRPYSEFKQIKFDFQIVISAAKSNRRPTIPKETPLKLRNIIKSCWETDPNDRPEAYTISDLLKSHN